MFRNQKFSFVILPLLSFSLFILVSSSAFAYGLNCVKTEYKDGDAKTSNFVVSSVEDPHGSLSPIVSEFFPDVTGFASLIQKDNRVFAVVSLYSESTQVNSSTQQQMTTEGQYLQHQLIIPSESLKLSAIEIICEYSLK